MLNNFLKTVSLVLITIISVSAARKKAEYVDVNFGAELDTIKWFNNFHMEPDKAMYISFDGF